jgi:hypothetical protein
VLIEAVAAGQVVAQDRGGPLAEASGTVGVHPVADRNDRIQIEMLYLIGFAVSRSCCIFCNN